MSKKDIPFKSIRPLIKYLQNDNINSFELAMSIQKVSDNMIQICEGGRYVEELQNDLFLLNNLRDVFMEMSK